MKEFCEATVQSAFLLFLAVGCSPAEDEWERSFMQAVALDACSHTLPTILQEELTTGRVASTEIQRVRDLSGLLSEDMKRDFLDRNRRPVGLTELVSVPTDCPVLPRAAIEKLGIERQWLPDLDAPPVPGLITLSRPGFSSDGSTGAVYWYWAGSGMCAGGFRVYARGSEERWHQVGQVEHLIC